MTTPTQRHHKNNAGARYSRALPLLGATATFFLRSGNALAQEFVKVADGSREQLPATPFVGLAYGFIWLALLLYVLHTARELGRLDRALTQLRRRLEGPAPSRARNTSSVGTGR